MFDGNFLQIEIPNLSCKPRFEIVDFQMTDEKNYTWMGRIPEYINKEKNEIDTLCWDGDIMINSIDNKVHGYIRLSSTNYEIYSFRDGKSILLETTGLGDSIPTCNFNFENNNISQSSNDKILKNGNTCTVDILAITNNLTADNSIDINEYIWNSFYQTRQGLFNSDIRRNNLVINLLGIVEVDASVFNPVTSSSTQTNISSLSENEEINAIREQYSADIVLFYSKGGLLDSRGVVAGGLDTDLAYGIIDVNNALYFNTVPHEIAHIFGGQHQRCDACSDFWNPGVCGNFCNDNGNAHAHFFSTGFWPIRSRKHTILDAGEDKKNKLILNFSNPDVRFRNVQTGTGNSDNAGSILINKCDVAAFKNNPNEPLSVQIVSPNTVCECVTFPISSQVSGEIPGSQVSYSWQVSYDNGFNYSVLPSNGPTLLVDMNCNQSSSGILVRVTVNNEGNSATVGRFINSTTDESESDIYCNYNISEGGVSSKGIISKINELNNVIIYPNPNNGIFTLSNLQVGANLRVFEAVSGRAVYSYEHNMRKAYNSVNVDLREFAKGIYIVEYRVNDLVKRYKIITGL